MADGTFWEDDSDFMRWLEEDLKAKPHWPPFDEETLRLMYVAWVAGAKIALDMFTEQLAEKLKGRKE